MTTRANNFDGLRLMGALFVLISHEFVIAGRSEGIEICGHSLGNLGVLLFFSISGYLITASWLNDSNLRRFANKRALRIWPGYAAVILIAPLIALLFVQPPHAFTMLTHYWPQVWFQGHECGFFWHSPQVSMNTSLWSIPFEIGCYGVLALAGIMSGKNLRWALLIGALVILVVFTFWMHAEEIYPTTNKTRPVAFTVTYFGSFFLAGGLLKCFPKALSKTGVASSLAIGAAGFIAGQVMVGLLFTVPVLAISIGLRSWPALRSAGKFGDLSYGLYLWGWPSQQIVLVLLGKSQPYGVLLAASVALATVFALLSWHLIEKPCLSRKPVAASKTAPSANKTSLTEPAVAFGC